MFDSQRVLLIKSLSNSDLSSFHVTVPAPVKASSVHAE